MKKNTAQKISLIVALAVPLLVKAQEPQSAATAPASPAQTLTAQSKEGETPVVANPVTSSEVTSPVAVQEGEQKNTQLNEITAPERVEPKASVSIITDSSKSKDTLSVDFPDEDIRAILRNVSDLFELNIVIPDTLQGRTSIKLRDVTWRQIFTVTLSPVGYTFVEDGNIIKIIDKKALELEPFITSSIVLQSVAATSVDAVLRSLLTPAVPASASSPGLPAGSLVLNSQANEYIITDRPTVVARAIKTAQTLDTEPRQVVIETKFVEVTDANALEFSLKTEGRMDLNKPFGANQVGGINTFKQTPISPLSTLLSGPSGAGATGAFNAVLNTKDYSVLLQALQSKTDTRIASNPTIVAVNGMKSTISVGKEIQLVKTTQTNSAGSDPISTTEKDGVIFEGIKIEVTPQITSKKLVSLAINANKTIASESASKAEGGTIKQVFYDINKREANLTMLLQDGQTAAIGGLVDRKADKVTTKVPLLGDIPIIGNLFKTKKNSDQNTNLIIFITANILEPSKTTYKNVSTSEQLYDLNVTERDIKGISYEKSAEEAQLYDATDKKRQDEQDAKIRLKLRVPNQKSK